MILNSEVEPLSEDEVIERVSNFDDLKNLITDEKQDDYSHFNWSNVIEELLPLLSFDEINEATDLVNKEIEGSEFYAFLSKKALDTNQKDLAISFANKSIELSRESGWVRFFDGGSRIKAFNALKDIDTKLSFKKAFEVFANDVINANYTGFYIESLEDILPLISENYNIEGVWSEIYSYLKRLMSNSTPIETLPLLKKSNKHYFQILIEYLVHLLNNPVPLIKKKSTYIIVKTY